ncbi:hypothetical protein DDZ13_05445 [Coraliomargarita sinensis]|uniref:Uncharacterized protein n=1 Tax=Coraliomargarita sinensis TaxID=2174842 RepID=A0A317ZKZ9_9BACT|nr:hypothetical protein [Coraliomargarita sinensis]PXA04618.1 hypothetical protein DDZ13_05445 [Coraliomargarita sinensis]
MQNNLIKATVQILCLVVTISSVANGEAITINFDGSQPYGSTRLISVYEEDGIHIKPVGAFSEEPPYLMGLSGSGVTNQSDSGSAHLTGIIAEIEIQSLTNQRFDANAVSLSEYSTSFATPQVITATGELADGSTVTTTFTTDGLIGENLTDFEIFNFPPEFTNLRALKLSNESGGFSMDDLLLNVIRGSSVDLVVEKIADTNSQLPLQQEELISLSKASLKGETVAFQSYEYGFTRKSIYASHAGELKHVATEFSTSIPNNGTFGVSSESTPLVNSNGEVYLEVLFGSHHGVLKSSEDNLSLAFDEFDVEQLVGSDTNWYAGHEIRMTDDERIVRMVDTSNPRQKWLIAYDSELSLINSPSPLSPSEIAYYDDYEVYSEGFAIVKDSDQTKLFRRDHLGVLEEFESGFSAMIPEGALIQISSLMANGRWAYVGVRFLPYGGMILGWSGNRWFELNTTGVKAHDGTMLNGNPSAKSLDRDSLLFNAQSELGYSVFLLRNGLIYRILSPGDLLDHDRINSISLSRYALDADQIAVSVVFEGGRQGVYVIGLENLITTQSEKLEMQLTQNADTVMTLNLEATVGAFYHLLFSESLENFKVLETVSAEGPLVEFTIDPKANVQPKMFYIVDEARYTPIPTEP